MVEQTFFSDLEAIDKTNYERPFFSMDLTSEDVILTWLKAEYNRIKNDNTDRLEKAKNNYLRYKGFQYFNTVYQPRDVLESSKKYTPQMVIPFISDAVDEKVARLMELKPFVTAVPKHDETIDKKDTKMANQFLSFINYTQKLDDKITKALRSSKIGGESFLWIRWNPDAGELMPENALIENSYQRQGDLEIVHKTLFNVKYPKLPDFKMVDYCFIDDFEYTEAIKREYPDKADKIHQDTDCKVFDYDTMTEVELKGFSRKIHFYHRRTKYLPQGFEACYVNGVLLKMGPLSYEHGELPIERIVDIHNDEEASGQSSIDKTKSIAAQCNNFMNMMIKQFMLAGYVKWFIEEGSVDEDQLNNDISIVKTKRGANKPVLAQANPVGSGTFEIFDKMRELFYDMSKSNSVIRGEPPTGVTAGVALQYVSESESRRLSTDVQVLNQFTINVNDKSLKVCGQFYQPDEQRKMMIQGKENKWEMLNLDIKSIAKPYNIFLQNTAAMSESKALQTQKVLDMEGVFPGMLPREQVAEMTGLSQGDKFLDIAGRAARAAEDENEHMSEGAGQMEPAEWEDHIAHWKIHVQEMQPMGFKTKAGPQILNDFVAHITAHEMFMMDQAKKNPTYSQLLLALSGFPMFMEPEPQPVVDPVTGLPIPGTEGLPPEQVLGALSQVPGDPMQSMGQPEQKEMQQLPPTPELPV